MASDTFHSSTGSPKMKSKKLHYCVLALALTLVTTCAMGGDREKIHRKLVEAFAHRNEVEEHWKREYQRYIPSESESESRESRGMQSRNKKREAHAEWRRSEMLGPSYNP
jgi:hypothetical protein